MIVAIPLLLCSHKLYVSIQGTLSVMGFEVLGALADALNFEDAPLQRQLLPRKSLFRPWNRTMRRQEGSAASLLLTSTLASSANLQIQVC